MRTNSFNRLLLKCYMYLAHSGKIRSFNKMQPATSLQHSPFPISQLRRVAWSLEALTRAACSDFHIWKTNFMGGVNDYCLWKSSHLGKNIATSCSFHLGSGYIMLWFSHFRDHNSFTSFLQTWYLLLRKALDKCWTLLISHYFCSEHASDSCWLQKAQSEFGFTGCSEGRDSQPAAR